MRAHPALTATTATAVVGVVALAAMFLHSAPAPAPSATPATFLLGGGGAPAEPSQAQRPLGSATTVGVVLFAEGSSDIDASGVAVLDSAAAEIRRRHASRALITGSTDPTGDAGANLNLALARATVVSDGLRARLPSTIAVDVIEQPPPTATGAATVPAALQRSAVIDSR